MFAENDKKKDDYCGVFINEKSEERSVAVAVIIFNRIHNKPKLMIQSRLYPSVSCCSFLSWNGCELGTKWIVRWSSFPRWGFTRLWSWLMTSSIWSPVARLDSRYSSILASTIGMIADFILSYGSDSPGREFWPICGPFLIKVEPLCDQTWWDIFDFSIDLG